MSMKMDKQGRRGDQTREALLLAAIEVFGRDGFNAASTRNIAFAAGANQALIAYHFGGKQGLYLAVFEHIVEHMRQRMAPVADQVRAAVQVLPVDPMARKRAAMQQLFVVFDAIVDMFSDSTTANWVGLVLREQQDPTPAFDILYEGMIGRLLGLLTHLIALVSGLDEASETCRIQTLLLMGQATVFNIARGSTSRHMNWGALQADHIATIKQQLHINLEAQFVHGVRKQ